MEEQLVDFDQLIILRINTLTGSINYSVQSFSRPLLESMFGIHLRQFRIHGPKVSGVQDSGAEEVFDL